MTLTPELRRELEADGWVLLRRGSYDRMRERHRVAQAMLDSEKRHNEHTTEWAHKAFREQDRLRDRLEVVFAEAVKLGVDVDLIAKCNRRTET